MNKHNYDNGIITPAPTQSLEDNGSGASVMNDAPHASPSPSCSEENTQPLFEKVFGIPASEAEEEEALESPAFDRPKTRTRKSKVAIGQEYEEFLVLAKSATPRLVIMRDLGLSDVAFNRHYLTALTTGEIKPIPDGTVFKPTSFPKEIRNLLGCSGADLISVETGDAGLVLKKI